jgi:hypothetical protein
MLSSYLEQYKQTGAMENAAPKHGGRRGERDSMGQQPRATICILTYGDYLPFFRRCFASVLQHTPRNEFELRLGFNDAPVSFAYAMSRCLPSYVRPATPKPGIEQLSLRNDAGHTVRLWNSSSNLYKEPMARRMLYDAPLTTDYTIWFDDDSCVEAGWWEELTPLLDRGVDYIGQEWWVWYFPGQTEMIAKQPWYRGVPFALRDGRPAVRFMTGGFVSMRTECLRAANFPDTEFRWKGDTLKQYGGDTLLGEIANQLGWTRCVHHQHVKINVDLQGNHPAPRRGGTGRQFGSDVDAVIR